MRCNKWKFREVKGEVELFNLEEDISESINIAADNPVMIEIMRQKRDEFDKELKADKRSTLK